MNGYLLTLRFAEETEPFLLDIASLLYDLDLTHDLGVLLTEPEYKDFQFTRYFWYRKGRRIKQAHRARAAEIVKRSPLLLELTVSSVGGLWVLLQIIEKVSNWSLSREKLELEVEKLRREREQDRERLRQQYADELGRLFDKRGAFEIAQNLTKRLSESPIQLVDLDVQKRNP